MLIAIWVVLCFWSIFALAAPRASLAAHPAHLVGLLTIVLLLAVQTVAFRADAPDRILYLHEFARLARQPTPWAGSGLFSEPAFNSLLWVVSRFSHTPTALYAVLATLIFGIYAVAAWRLGGSRAAYFAVFVALSSGLLLAYASITVRQGLAATVLATGVAAFGAGGKRRYVLGAAAIAPLFHWSASILSVILVLCIWRQPKLPTAALIWVVVAAVALTGVNQQLLGAISPQISNYSTTAAYDQYGREGTSLVFLLFSGVFVALSWLVDNRGWVGQEQRVTFERLGVLYVGFNLVYAAFSFVAYSDRLAAYSWLLIPMLVWVFLESRPRQVGLLGPVALVLTAAVGVASGSWGLLLS